jgi:hypothetical protein
MSRTTLCGLTALILALGSGGLMLARHLILGDGVRGPTGPGTWKVTLIVQGRSTTPDARLTTAVPLDCGRQHIANEICRSNELVSKPPDARHPERQQVVWTHRPAFASGAFRASYQFDCTVNARSPSVQMLQLSRRLYEEPAAGADLSSEPRIESSADEITELTHELAGDADDPEDRLSAFYHFVDQQIDNEPTVHGVAVSAAECLRRKGGDSAAKARLLAALCRNRGIPARLVTGITLKRGREQQAHAWIEAWVHGVWIPACPFYHHFGHVPSSYLVLALGDAPVVRGRKVHDLDYAFYVERPPAESSDAVTISQTDSWRHFLNQFSLFALPPAEQRLVEFLLLLPIAALIVCFYRNVIGLGSFGTFAPALIGLAFRELGGLPGILVFVAVVLVGWLLRRLLEYYHLLQVPRMAFLLSMIIIVLVGAIMAANFHELPATRYVSLFPIVILTGMIERFWTQETEDGTASSFRTLLTTLLIAVSISLVVGLHAVVRHMIRYPETLGLIMAAQLVLGRYTGYRLLELYRFRALLKPQPAL